MKFPGPILYVRETMSDIAAIGSASSRRDVGNLSSIGRDLDLDGGDLGGSPGSRSGWACGNSNRTLGASAAEAGRAYCRATSSRCSFLDQRRGSGSARPQRQLFRHQRRRHRRCDPDHGARGFEPDRAQAGAEPHFFVATPLSPSAARLLAEARFAPAAQRRARSLAARRPEGMVRCGRQRDRDR